MPELDIPHVLQADGLVTTTIAILLFFVGRRLNQRFAWLRRYSIPEPVVGGLFCAIVVGVLYYGFGRQVQFTLDARDVLLLYFFAAIGLNSDVRTLRQGGWPLLILVLLAGGFILLQNGVGMAVASAFGMDPRAGLMTGSVSLTGGVGTTLAWAPYFIDTLGIANAGELGLASNMLGLIAACVVGGPIARFLMQRHGIAGSGVATLEIGTGYEQEPRARLRYEGVLHALFWLNMALIVGQGISALIDLTGLNLPDFVGCLMAGIVIRSIGDLLRPRVGRLWNWPAIQPGVALISDICLGLFLTMALMGLQVWLLQDVLGFVATVITLQVLLVVLFTVFVVFRLMGRNYEAVVVCAGFGGITLGSTATAVANMSAVTRQYGNAPQAMLIVPLVCGFFIDLANALMIGVLAG